MIKFIHGQVVKSIINVQISMSVRATSCQCVFRMLHVLTCWDLTLAPVTQDSQEMEWIAV